MRRIFLPVDNTQEASVIPDVEVIGIEKLSDIVDILTGEAQIPE